MDHADVAALRLDLTNQGVSLAKDLVSAGFDLAFSGDAASEGIDLVLPGGWWTNVCIAPGYARTSPWELSLIDAGDPPRFILRHRTRGTIPVGITDTVRFRHSRTASQVSCSDIGAVHGSWVVIAPIAPREGLGLDRPRRFLGLPPRGAFTKSRWSVDEVVACAEAAWHHAGARLVHLEAGHLLAADGGVAELTPYIQALHRALPTLISVNVLPPEDPAEVLALYANGCDAISYHLLAWDGLAAAEVAPIRARFVDRARTLAALAAAARCFPPGAVSTDLLVGLEPISHLEAALDHLIPAGIVPNLAVFRPLAGAEDDAPHGELVPSEPLLRLMDVRLQRIRVTPLWRSRVRGFPRTLSGFDRYQASWRNRLYAAVRRALRVRREAA